MSESTQAATASHLVSPPSAGAPAADDARARWRQRIDRFGAGASLLCALHCAALPLIVVALPMLGLGFLADHRFEQGFVAFASTLAVTSLGLGFRHHRRLQPFGLLLPAIALLLGGVWFGAEHFARIHVVLVTLGGCLLAGAHVANLRLAQRHRCEAPPRTLACCR
ncbi:MAG: MerC domain-containing protein [Xanthomonadales bacterium]|nr:MerC domain-containing protein [Xanthomonadales bacterium]MCW5578916.1 MerC domain-containing protein [Dokdonella sp.]MDL1868673.1 MerC domain-containing protein [Gammaproteobacteria bacterium PRO6]